MLRPDDSMEKQRVKLDLLIGIMCLFMVLLIFLVVGCLLLHFRLFTKDMPLKEDLKSYTIQTHCVETKFVLAPSQTNQLASSGWTAPEKPTETECKARSSTPPDLTLNHKSAISYMYQSHSPESLYLDETGSIYSLEFFPDLDSSCWSDSKESLMCRNSQEEDGEGSNESGSTIFCTVHPM
ncbi:uncharacterized protein LOC117679564 isoform X2 [Pantherophis guttatus]|uniref:Uncharacterized protein LOC117679564 isoform X2 n=1 Tax=Pantherophis guttatus TaxID=94885 RepID=A0A6P9DYA1_PANGU|nr:uncharacterized protein LOC117679564 isoform X2 [Pantherophis guttatus]